MIGMKVGKVKGIECIDIIERIKERSALGISLMMFFFYDRADLKTLELFGNEVLPAFA